MQQPETARLFGEPLVAGVPAARPVAEAPAAKMSVCARLSFYTELDSMRGTHPAHTGQND